MTTPTTTLESATGEYDDLMRVIRATGEYAMDVIYLPSISDTDDPEEFYEHIVYYDMEYGGGLWRMKVATADPVVTHLHQVKRGLTNYRKQLNTNQELVMVPSDEAGRVMDAEYNLLALLDHLVDRVDEEIEKRREQNDDMEPVDDPVPAIEELIRLVTLSNETTA